MFVIIFSKVIIIKDQESGVKLFAMTLIFKIEFTVVLNVLACCVMIEKFFTNHQSKKNINIKKSYSGKPY